MTTGKITPLLTFTTTIFYKEPEECQAPENRYRKRGSQVQRIVFEAPQGEEACDDGHEWPGASTYQDDFCVNANSRLSRSCRGTKVADDVHCCIPKFPDPDCVVYPHTIQHINRRHQLKCPTLMASYNTPHCIIQPPDVNHVNQTTYNQPFCPGEGTQANQPFCPVGNQGVNDVLRSFQSKKEKSEQSMGTNFTDMEWINRPLPEIAREIQSNLMTCRVGGLDTSHYDFYHHVRMKRDKTPDPERSFNAKFVTCSVIPSASNR